jgi:hypothetical protein
MLDKDSIKVILAFTGMILLGLVSMVILDSMKGVSTDNTAKVENNLTK